MRLGNLGWKSRIHAARVSLFGQLLGTYYPVYRSTGLTVANERLYWALIVDIVRHFSEAHYAHSIMKAKALTRSDVCQNMQLSNRGKQHKLIPCFCHIRGPSQ